MSDKLPLLLSLTLSIINKAGAVRLKMLTIYNELVKNPPFPAWKSGFVVGCWGGNFMNLLLMMYA